MKDFIERDAEELDDVTLLEWMGTPGRLGSLELGANADGIEGEEWFGDEDGPETPDEPEDDWQKLAAHHGIVNVDDDGRIESITYAFRALTPTPMCFHPEPTPNPRIDDLRDALEKALAAKLGKATRRTKKQTDFEWDGGELTLELGVSTFEPWNTVSLELRCSGTAPFKG